MDAIVLTDRFTMPTDELIRFRSITIKMSDADDAENVIKLIEIKLKLK